MTTVGVILPHLYNSTLLPLTNQHDKLPDSTTQSKRLSTQGSITPGSTKNPPIKSNQGCETTCVCVCVVVVAGGCQRSIGSNNGL